MTRHNMDVSKLSIPEVDGTLVAWVEQSYPQWYMPRAYGVVALVELKGDTDIVLDQWESDGVDMSTEAWDWYAEAPRGLLPAILRWIATLRMGDGER